ncbi:hypothetical protein DEMA109039_12330 [Deinococcus marmoris]|nr:hypothetical protein [Deinococcus marmoris]
MTTAEQHRARSESIEASLGIPNTEFCDRYGPLSIPYLAPSWREIRIVQALSQMEPAEQTGAIYLLVQRRLPELTYDEFEDLTGPDHFPAWWTATQPPRSGEAGGGDFSTGRAPSRPSAYSSLLSSGGTRH